MFQLLFAREKLSRFPSAIYELHAIPDWQNIFPSIKSRVIPSSAHHKAVACELV